jgi:Protein of unknown function (DUF1552)
MRSQSSRRTFIRGAGIALGLPLLESLLPARAFAQAVAPKRLLYWLIPNGVIYSRWKPAAGPLNAATLPECLKPLAGMVKDVSVLSGIDNLAGVPVAVGDHASGIAAALTCVPAKKAALSDLGLGVSSDQVAAQALGKFTTRPSLELGMARSGGTGDCDNGYACAYAQVMSWENATTPRAKKTDPHDAFLYLLGTNTTTMSTEERDRLRAGDQSVLDYVLAPSQSLTTRIGAEDRAKLEQYFTGVRAVERQLLATMNTNPECQATAGPANSADYVTRFGAMMDVMEFAFKCDLTRVQSFMFGNAFGPGPMSWLDIKDDYHALTHRMGDAGVPDLVAKCITWEVSQVAAFMKRLQAIPEGDHNVLYNTSFVVLSDVGQGGPHNHDDIPVLLAGNGGGALNPGRHVVFTPEDSSARRLAGSRTVLDRTKALAIPNTNRMANLHLALLQSAGVAADRFADSTGPLKGL